MGVTARDYEKILWRHVLDPWFPRCLDRAYGGFLCDFDIAWQNTGPDEKLIEFQARQTLLAAEAALRYPAAAHLAEAALHGYRFLAGPMWDHEHGGWFHRTDRAGAPLEAETKHTHGFAYAIVACLAVHDLTGDPAPLELAQSAALWIDRHAHDPGEGGYFGLMDRGGAVIRAPGKIWKASLDPLGLPLGGKDANIHTDMLETLARLAALSGGETAAARLAELMLLFETRLVQANGALPYVFTADWRPLPPPEHTGYLLQGAHRLLRLAESSGAPPGRAAAAKRMMAHALATRWDARRGGFYETGPHADGEAGSTPASVDKNWWDQWEGLRALIDFGDDSARSGYARYARDQWRYITRHILDRRRGGTFWYGLDGHSAWRRLMQPKDFAPRRPAKGEAWKDASHEGRALLHCLQRIDPTKLTA